MAAQEFVATVRDDLRQLRWQKTLHPAEPLHLAHLLGDAPLEFLVPGAQLFGLPRNGRKQLFFRVAQPLLLQAGADTCLQEDRVERLRQVVLGAQFYAAHDAVGLVDG